MAILREIKKCCTTDIDSIIREVNRISRMDVSAPQVAYETSRYIGEDEFNDGRCIAHVKFTAGDVSLKFSLKYRAVHDEVKRDFNTDTIVQNLIDVIDSSEHNIDAATRVVGDSEVVGATDQDNYDSDQTISDDIADLSDKVDDLQDSVDDAQEDDVDIEIDNNISGHYIAECDNCHGVFISAMIESDQQVEKISGVCPLCNKQSDQYLKWIVKEANSSTQ